MTRAARFFLLGTMRFFAAFVALALLVGWRSEPPRPPVRTEHLAPVLPDRNLLKVLGAPHRFLISDYYWVQAIQAVGKARSQEEYADAYHYADLTTDLDPGFRQVYAFAGAAIPFNLGRERWVNTELSTRLLEKGLRHFPQDLQLHILLAYNYSYFHKRYREAADLLVQASKLPGAPAYLAPLATRLYAQAGQFSAGAALADSLAGSTDDPEVQAFFERRKQEIALEEELTTVDKAVEVYRARTGRLPVLTDLLIGGDLARPPRDPFGGTIFIDEDGLAQSTTQTRRLQVFDPLESNE